MNIDFEPVYLALYPEIHFTFDLFFSRLGHSQPEILIDCPWRMNPGKSIPLLFIVKHANRFPILLHSISVEMLYEDGTKDRRNVWDTPVLIRNYLWHRIFSLTPKAGYSGDVLISAHIQIQKSGTVFWIMNHNYRGAVNAPLRVHLAKEPLPALKNWYYGESHYHSFFSDDQVEFGAPVSVAAQMAAAMGLNWLAITDHSYDLDDTYGATLHHDHELLKWKKLKNDVQQENSHTSSGVTVILGEEISCGNARNKNIHLLAYGIGNFIPGSGDGAEHWFRTQPDLPLKEVLRKVKEDGGVAYAAHPEERFTLGERFMLRRGHWEKEDYELEQYTGLQFWNGKRDNAFYEGYKKWVEMLLKGRRLYILGGDDSHGDFNLFRQMRIPLIKLTESPYKVFGRVRTCIFCEDEFNEKTLLTSLQNGHTMVTSGPFISLSVHTEQGEIGVCGQEISGSRVRVEIAGRSSEEFGGIDHILLYTGNVREQKEKKREFHYTSDFHNPKNFEIKDISIPITDPMYLRLEATSHKARKTYYAYTNPIWLKPA